MGKSSKSVVFVVGSYAHFQSFGIHNNMGAESAIEKLQQIVRKRKRKGMNTNKGKQRKRNY